MRECPLCFNCYAESVEQCPKDGRATFHSLPGDVALEGKYVLERRLGEGGMGIVYKAHHKFLKTTRAIKIIRRELVGNDPSFATRFHQEAMTAALIGHPNIISVPDFGFLEEKIPFIVMEFVEGISLQDLMTREGRFSPQRALEYMSVITSAVSAAHAAGIVHRDLKPLNIMIQSGGTVREQIRILDFGLAKIKSDLFGSFVGAKTTGIIGSPYYMAPEQWSDEETDKRCDVYSLGIMLYQMLMGDVPFGGTGIPVIMKKHLMEPPPPLALPDNGISPELEKVVHHALEKEPENRTPSAEAFIEELEKAVEAKGKTKRSRKAKSAAAGSRRKTNDTGSDSLGPSPGSISQHEQSAGGISGPELNTIVSPSAQTEVEEVRVSLQPSSLPTQSESDLLRKAREEASRIAEERAIREFEESGEMPHVAAQSLPRQPPPPTLPGRLAVGQHSAPGIFFRKRFVVPVVTAVVLVGVIVLATFMYVQSDTEQPVVATQPPARTVKLRDMALIEGGEFTMGSNSSGEMQRGEHRVTVPSFYLDKYEVTNADYAEFIKATGRPAPMADPRVEASYWKPWNGNDPPAGRERWPVCNVSPKDAEAFAEWLSKRDGVKYRLPSEEEWEFAARNRTDGSLFPWGNSWDERRANLNQKSSPQNVGSFADGVTKDGIYDMVGNVWEWTSSKASFYNGSQVEPDDVNARIRRGGSFAEPINSQFFQNSTTRQWHGDDNYKFPTIGFRLARNRE
ncbi:MAG TPA: bifunctional serine/threonine-protein kinase/formylglycine-generating enzyme family protein [Pyrinomonadaceae bacterium]|nr:bifunctional serine/threonine-protein kinase/formylglycine-generating enzyme family protein [Pyrinomonadaceae bacterium]